MVVARAGDVDVWQCALCGRGSPDARDEVAHVDAHLRLRRDPFAERWDHIGRGLIGERSPACPVARPRTWTVAAAVVAMCGLFCVLGLVMLRTGRGAPSPPGTPARAPLPTRDVVAPPAPASSTSPIAPDRPTRDGRPAGSTTAVASGTADIAPDALGPPPLVVSGQPSPGVPTPAPAAAARTYLLRISLFGIEIEV
jgi:hypothetical protein